MKLRVKVYGWGDFFGNGVTYYLFPDGRVCRIETDDNAKTWRDVYDYYHVPFVGY